MKIRQIVAQIPKYLGRKSYSKKRHAWFDPKYSKWVDVKYSFERFQGFFSILNESKQQHCRQCSKTRFKDLQFWRVFVAFLVASCLRGDFISYFLLLLLSSSSYYYLEIYHFPIWCKGPISNFFQFNAKVL